MARESPSWGYTRLRGTVERRGALWCARIGAQGKPRKRLPMAGSESWTRTQAKREAAKLAVDYTSGRIVFDEKPRKGAVASHGAITTVRQLGAQWTSGDMVRMYGNVNRLRVKAGAQIDAWCLKANAYEVRTRGPSAPVFGDLPVADVTTDDVAKVMAAQPAGRSETRVKQYNRLHRLFDLAIVPLRLRPDNSNPVVKYLRPSPDADKLFCFLYPSEVLALLKGRVLARVPQEDGTSADLFAPATIPLARRVLYALAVYTGQRKGSLFALRWNMSTSTTAPSRASRRRPGRRNTSSPTAA
jgi:hypothetical protein